MNNKNDAAVIGGSTESVDLAALLMALGFHLIDAKVIESIDITSSRGRQQPKTMSWTFSRKSLDNQYDMDKVKGKWKLPKAYTLDAIPLSRLLAHNLAMLKSLARQPRNVIFSDLGGIGIISDYAQSKNSRDIMIHNSGIGGVSDSATAALAITLGVIPQDIVIERGRLSVSFLMVENQVSINDIQHIMKDDKMRHPENMHAVAILVC